MADEKTKAVFTTDVVRGSYPNLVQAKSFEEGGKEKFSMTFLAPKKGKELSDAFPGLQKMINQVKTAAFGPDKAKWPKGQPIFHDGDEKADVEGYKGMVYISAKNERKPSLWDRKMNVLTDESQIYGGCFVKAVIRVYAYPKGPRWGAGIGLSLEAVQKHSDGDSFGSRIDPREYLGALEDESESEENYNDNAETETGSSAEAW